MGPGDRDRSPTRNPTVDPTTRAEFEAALELLVRAAAANGVRVDGGFALRHPSPESPDWGLELTRLRQRRVTGTDTDTGIEADTETGTRTSKGTDTDRSEVDRA